MCCNYDDIRPYHDAEIPAAMRAVAAWEHFAQIVRFIYPDADPEQKRQQLLGINTVHQFQATFMNDAIKRIVTDTTTGFTFGGLQYLKRDVPYIFVSNHRDITLDAFLLQHVLIENRGDTSHIVFGQNLLQMPIIEVLFRSNKLIRMERGGTPRAFYQSLQHLSGYINMLVVEQKQSVWIAQRNGRTKDGRDNTAPAIVKMLALGSKRPAAEALAALHIVPMSISYEWDPCDVMKATELYASRSGSYTKAPDEDTRSVVTGIMGHKGMVHLEVGKPLSAKDIAVGEGGDVYDHVAEVLDARIQTGYRLMPTNYVAYDMLHHSGVGRRVSPLVRDRFEARIAAVPNAEIRQLMVEAYAAPVEAALRRK